MGKREDALLSEQLQRMVDLGAQPVELPDGPKNLALDEPAWSPSDIAPAEEVAGDDVGGSPDTSEESPIREDGPSSPAMPESIPNEGHYIGLRNGSQPGPDGWKAPEIVNCTMAEAEGGTHGSSELDADAEKLIAMGQDPGPTLEDLGLTPDEVAAVVEQRLVEPEPEMAEDVVTVIGDNLFATAYQAIDEPDFAEVEGAEPGGAEPFVEIPLKQAWVVGDLCVWGDDVAEITLTYDDGFLDLDVLTISRTKGGYEWRKQRITEVEMSDASAATTDAHRLFAEAYRQHLAARASEEAAEAAHQASADLVRAHTALVDAERAMAQIGRTVSVATITAA